MANTAQAKKRVRQNNKVRLHKAGLKSRLRTTRKKLLAALAEKNIDNAKSALQEALSTIDKGVNKNIVKKNTAARYKSRAVSAFKKLEQSL